MIPTKGAKVGPEPSETNVGGVPTRRAPLLRRDSSIRRISLMQAQLPKIWEDDDDGACNRISRRDFFYYSAYAESSGVS
jgi:hypothetical protein